MGNVVSKYQKTSSGKNVLSPTLLDRIHSVQPLESVLHRLITPTWPCPMMVEAPNRIQPTFVMPIGAVLGIAISISYVTWPWAGIVRTLRQFKRYTSLVGILEFSR
jgi:hypothetical protein